MLDRAGGALARRERPGGCGHRRPALASVSQRSWPSPNGAYGLGLLLFLANRVADGLDGAVARHTGLSDLGGFLDIVLDFLVYAGMVFAFAFADPAANALAAAFLLFAFMGTGSSFLAFAVMAAKRGFATERRGRKSLYYLGGLTEGVETILFLALACLLPAGFPWLALGFALLCWITTACRIVIAVQLLRESGAGNA